MNALIHCVDEKLFKMMINSDVLMATCIPDSYNKFKTRLALLPFHYPC